GEMDNPDPQKYVAFLSSSWSETVFYEFRLEGELAMVAVVDWMEQGLSAVYTFFAPELEPRSLGT
ncbi:MAG: arginyltransferase, partial [Gammaproteobacteria bacterium]|nr:arginyltransferase [Gammaproteobacteria bacterium]